MVIILEFLLILTAVTLIVARGNSKEYKLLGVSLLWLALNVLTVIIYISKKGGLDPQSNSFFFLSNDIKRFLQYLEIRLSHLGYLMVIGRTLFPVFVLRTALKNNMVPRFRKLVHHAKWFWLPITVILVIYFPTVFHSLYAWNASVTMTILRGLDLFLIAYVLVSLVIVVTELFAIQLKIYRQRYVFFCILFFIVCIIYFTNFIQNPVQIYQFYTTEFVWQSGLFSLLSILNLRLYVILIVISFLAAFIGIIALSKYTKMYLRKTQFETRLRKKKEEVAPPTTMFIHSVKNQYLANKVLYKRIEKEIHSDEVDMNKVKDYIRALQEENHTTLTRIEELYKSIRGNVVILKPYQVDDIVETLKQLYKTKYPNGNLSVTIQDSSQLLLDKELFLDAMLNLLINAQEAIDVSGNPKGQINLTLYNVRAYCVFKITDNGIGMNEMQNLEIFEPFSSSKNSKTNWGVGLYFVKTIIDNHYGDIDFYNNENGIGATFEVNIPLFKWER